ncbi:MAG TPA: hypothetical protein VF184_00690 [Phycisphaeraceae bacterium]
MILRAVLLAVTWLAVTFALPAAAQINKDAYYSVQPWADLHPGFTNQTRPKFTLDLSGVGREALTMRRVQINGRTLPDGAWRVELNKLTITPDRDLRKGLNRVEIRYDHPADSKHKSNPVSYVFHVNYQPNPNMVRLGARGELIVNGKPVFVVGGYRSGQVDAFVDALPSARDSGFNLVHDYWFENQDIEDDDDLDRYIQQARQYLGRAHQLGLGVFLGLPRSAVSGMRGGAYNEPVLARIIAELSGEPALWLWYIMDEPNTDKMTIADAARVYRLIKRLDPNHPAIMLTNLPERTLEFGHFCDVLWYDRYPIIASSDRLRSLAPLSRAVHYNRKMVPEKPLWLVLQGHDARASRSVRRKMPGLSMPSDSDHRPNEAEVRAQAHLAIAQGLMAVVYYWGPDSWYSMRDDTPGVWKSFSTVMHELRELEPVLLSTQPVPEFHIAGGNDKVVMWSRALNDRVCVGLVNTSCHVPSRLSIAPISGVGRAEQVLGDGEVQFGDREAAVELGPAGVVVLEWNVSNAHASQAR